MHGPRLLLGDAAALPIGARLRQRFQSHGERHGPLRIRVIACTGDSAAAGYGRAIARQFAGLGVKVDRVSVPGDVSQDGMVDTVTLAGTDETVQGVLILEPYPREVDPAVISQVINPDKDLDCISHARLGALFAGHSAVAPATAAAVVAILEHYAIPIEGKRAVVIGRSNIAGKPAAALLLARHATVTLCHTRTRDLAAEIRRGEIIVAAAGVPGLVKGEHVSEGAVVVDVGTNYMPAGLVGDVDFATVAPKAAAITPVPRGIGPLTNMMLAANLAALLQEHERR